MSKIMIINIILLISVLLIFILAPNGHALFKRDMKKARKFIDAGNYQKAIPLLETAVLERFTDSEAHFLLGVSYLNNNNSYDADQVFELAVKLEPDYGNEIGRMYKEASIRSLNRGEVIIACSLFEEAVEHYPMIDRGIKTFLSGETRNIEYYKRCINDTKGKSKDLSHTDNGISIYSSHGLPDKKINGIAGNTISIKGNAVQKQAYNGILIHGIQQLPAKESEDLNRITGVRVRQKVVSEYYMKPNVNVVFEKRFSLTMHLIKNMAKLKLLNMKKMISELMIKLK